MNYAKVQRLRFIDFCLHHYGYINRRILVDYFGVGEASATRDITDYRNLYPDNIIYCVTNKRYNKAENFKPKY